MNNETLTAPEKRIYFGDLLWQVLASWRVLVGMILVFALLFNVYGYMKRTDDYQVHYEQTADEIRQQLTEEQLESVNTAFSTLAQVQSEKNYLNRSILISLDPNRLNEVQLTYQVQTGYHLNLSGESKPDTASELVAMYTAVLGSDEFLSALASSIGWNGDTLYLSELITVKSDSQLAASSTQLFENDNLIIVILGQTADQASALADAIQMQLASYHSDFSAVAGDYTLQLLSRNQSLSIDKSIVDKKNSCITRVTDMETKYAQLVAKMSQLQKDLLAKLTTNSELETETEDLVTVQQHPPILQPKYLVVGAVFGLLVAVGWAAVRYLLSQKVKSGRELKDLYGFEYLAALPVADAGKKRMLGGVDAWLRKLRYKSLPAGAQQLPMVTGYLKAICARNDIRRLLFCAPEALEPGDRQLMDSLLGDGSWETVQVELCEGTAADPAALERMMLCEDVVLVLREGKSLHSVVQEQLALCRKEGTRIWGCLMTE